jgi:hypothetical protein
MDSSAALSVNDFITIYSDHYKRKVVGKLIEGKVRLFSIYNARARP